MAGGIPSTFVRLTEAAFQHTGDWEAAVEKVLSEHRHWSPATCSLYVRGYVCKLVREGKVSQSFYERLKKMYRSPSRSYALRNLREEMLKEIFASAAGMPNALLWMAIMAVLAILGVRRESIVRLRTEDVEEADGLLHLRMFIPKKRGNYYLTYTIPLDIELGGVALGKLLEAYHKMRMQDPPGYYFYTRDPAKPIHGSYISAQIQKIGRKAGLDLETQDFRRYALNRIATKRGVAVAAAIAAHSNIKTTQRYLSTEEILRIIGPENAVR